MNAIIRAQQTWRRLSSHVPDVVRGVAEGADRVRDAADAVRRVAKVPTVVHHALDAHAFLRDAGGVGLVQRAMDGAARVRLAADVAHAAVDAAESATERLRDAVAKRNAR